MPMFKVEIAQHFKAVRTVVLEVEADDIASAVELQEGLAAPDTDDPRWSTEWDLQSEQVYPA